MRQKSVPAPRAIETSYLKVDNDLMKRLRDTKVVIFRAVCDGTWAKTRVALLENREKRCRWNTTELEVEMKLSEFYKTIEKGREIIFYGRTAQDSGEDDEVVFMEKGPFIHEGQKAVFVVESIACNDRFRLKNCMSDGPENDME